MIRPPILIGTLIPLFKQHIDQYLNMRLSVNTIHSVAWPPLESVYPSPHFRKYRLHAAALLGKTRPVGHRSHVRYPIHQPLKELGLVFHL